MEIVFNARFYFSVKRHVTLLDSHVGEIRMIATVFNPGEPYMKKDEEGDYVIFRTKDVYTPDVTSIKLDGQMVYVKTDGNTTYCILPGNKW